MTPIVTFAGLQYDRAMGLRAYIRTVARPLLLVYLMAVFVTSGWAAVHGHGLNHAAEHFSPDCHWLCAAATGIHSADAIAESTPAPVPEQEGRIHAGAVSRLSVFSIRNRSPPFPAFPDA